MRDQGEELARSVEAIYHAIGLEDDLDVEGGIDWREQQLTFARFAYTFASSSNIVFADFVRAVIADGKTAGVLTLVQRGAVGGDSGSGGSGVAGGHAPLRHALRSVISSSSQRLSAWASMAPSTFCIAIARRGRALCGASWQPPDERCPCHRRHNHGGLLGAYRRQPPRGELDGGDCALRARLRLRRLGGVAAGSTSTDVPDAEVR